MSAKHPKRKERPDVDRAGRTPLHYAAINGDVATVQRLLAEGQDPDAGDDEGWTPLHFAAQGNAAEAAWHLLEAGASVDARDSEGCTPLYLAVWRSRGNGDVIEVLRLYEADPHAQNGRGGSPLKLARSIANFNVRQYFNDLPEEADAEQGAPADRPRD